MTDSLTDYIAKNHKTHLIFDFDATLVFMNIPWKKWGENMRSEVAKLDKELWEQYEGQSATHMQNALVEKHGDSGAIFCFATAHHLNCSTETNFKKIKIS